MMGPSIAVVMGAALAFCCFVFVGLLAFAVLVCRLIDRVHNRHMDDMRYHVSRFADQVLAISEANMLEIRDRRAAEVELRRSDAGEAEALLRRAAGVDGGPEFDGGEVDLDDLDGV